MLTSLGRVNPCVKQKLIDWTWLKFGHGLPAQKLLYNNNYKESGNGTDSGAESN